MIQALIDFSVQNWIIQLQFLLAHPYLLALIVMVGYTVPIYYFYKNKIKYAPSMQHDNVYNHALGKTILIVLALWSPIIMPLSAIAAWYINRSNKE